MAAWGLQEHLIAATLDQLQISNWLVSHGKPSEYPKQTPRPGVEPDEKVTKGDVMPIDEMEAWLGW